MNDNLLFGWDLLMIHTRSNFKCELSFMVSPGHFITGQYCGKLPIFSEFIKKTKANLVKNSILTRLVSNKKKQCSIRMLVGLHTHYQMHLASKFTLFFFYEIWLNLGVLPSNIVDFYKNEHFFFIKKCIGPPYKKLKPLKSAFIKKLEFWN